MFLLLLIPLSFIIIFLTGSILLARTYSLARISATWPSSPATILSCRIRTYSDANNNREWTIRIRYTFQVEQATFENKRVFFAGLITGQNKKKMFLLEEAYKKGEQVKVFYNPANPQIATLETGVYPTLRRYLFFSVAGLIFSSAVFIGLLLR